MRLAQLDIVGEQSPPEPLTSGSPERLADQQRVVVDTQVRKTFLAQYSKLDADIDGSPGAGGRDRLLADGPRRCEGCQGHKNDQPAPGHGPDPWAAGPAGPHAQTVQRVARSGAGHRVSRALEKGLPEHGSVGAPGRTPLRVGAPAERSTRGGPSSAPRQATAPKPVRTSIARPQPSLPGPGFSLNDA